MTRSLFETPSDRERERQVAALLAAAWSCVMQSMPPRCEVDYLARRGGTVLAVVEIKSRLNRGTADYGATTFLNVHKRDALIRAADQFGGRPIFVWHFTDDVRWLDVRHIRLPVETRGRTDRDGLDTRAAFRIPIALTRPVRSARQQLIEDRAHRIRRHLYPAVSA